MALFTTPDTVTVTMVRLALTPGGDQADVASAASLDDTDLDAAIGDAADEVAARIGNQVALPLADPAPSLAVTLVVDIAAYLATLTWRRGDPLPAGHPVGLRYERAQNLLTLITAGKAALTSGEDDQSGSVDVGAADVTVINPNAGPLFDTTDAPVDFTTGSGRVVGYVGFPGGSLG